MHTVRDDRMSKDQPPPPIETGEDGLEVQRQPFGWWRIKAGEREAQIWVPSEIEAAIRAQDRAALEEAREAFRAYVETPGIEGRDEENWNRLRRALGAEAVGVTSIG